MSLLKDLHNNPFLKDFIKWLSVVAKDNKALKNCVVDDRYLLSTIAEYFAVVLNIGIIFNPTGYIIYRLTVFNNESTDKSILIRKEYKTLNNNYIDNYKKAVLAAIDYINTPF